MGALRTTLATLRPGNRQSSAGKAHHSDKRCGIARLRQTTVGSGLGLLLRLGCGLGGFDRLCLADAGQRPAPLCGQDHVAIDRLAEIVQRAVLGKPALERPAVLSGNGGLTLELAINGDKGRDLVTVGP